MRSSNPFLRSNLYSHLERGNSQSGTMTASGTANKAALLILVVFGSALFGWVSAGNGSSLAVLGGIAGFALAIFTMFKPTIAPITAPLYAVFEGLFLGSVSFMFEMQFPGIATQAVMGTIGVFMIMMILYRTGIITVTDRMRSIVTSLLLGIVATYFISFILSFFTGYSIFNQGGIFGLGFSLLIIGVAAFTLLLDLDTIERAESYGQDKRYEWFYALSLLITLVWLYLEMLRLLSILKNDN